MDEETHPLAPARAAVEQRAWEVAYAALSAADADAGIGDPADLQRLALSAYLTGRSDVAETAWARAHQAFLDRGDRHAAVRCAFWLGMVLLVDAGAEIRGGGWIARAQRLVEELAEDGCAERGYLLLPAALGALDGGDTATAVTGFARAAEAGERLGEPDLAALGRLGQGQALIRAGEPARGAASLDAAMVVVGTGRVSPVAAGLVYCAVILACQELFDVRRAQQWTEALTRWCDAQTGLVPYQGQCLVHRSQLAQLRGSWGEAVAEAERACRWLSDPPRPAAGMAYYQRAELHRLRGEQTAAEAAYAHAAELGHDPHPGLALLWCDQGRTASAVGAMRRLVDGGSRAYPPVASELADPRSRAELLAAYVEVMLAAAEVGAAATAAAELEQAAERIGTRFLSALAWRARGSVLLAQGRPGPALEALTVARATFARLPAPYEAARARLLIARAMRALGDEDTARIELTAAHKVFEEAGATADLERVAALASAAADAAGAAVTPRELDVIRLVAAGRSNREVAEELVISDKTVARHLHNVMTRLGLPNRAAVTAYAYEHDLLRTGIHRNT